MRLLTYHRPSRNPGLRARRLNAFGCGINLPIRADIGFRLADYCASGQFARTKPVQHHNCQNARSFARQLSQIEGISATY